MHRSRKNSDPRTIGRDIISVFEAVFPLLVPGLVMHLNKSYSYEVSGCDSLPDETLNKSSLHRAMLFEIAIAIAEDLIFEKEVVWDICFERACLRQQSYYDAQIPTGLQSGDREAALHVARNLERMLMSISLDHDNLLIDPRIPGYRWISNGVGDFATESSIIEVKCRGRRFSTADYRQVIMYWLLSYIESLEKDRSCWDKGILINPRLNLVVEFEFSELIPVISSGRSLIEVVELFSAVVDEVERPDTAPN